MTDVAVSELDLHPDRGLGRAFVLGSVIGFVVVFASFGGLALGAGLDPAPAAGLGLFTAVWGGPGFGGMMGAVLHHESDAEAGGATDGGTSGATPGGAAG